MPFFRIVLVLGLTAPGLSAWFAAALSRRPGGFDVGTVSADWILKKRGRGETI